MREEGRLKKAVNTGVCGDLSNRRLGTTSLRTEW